MKNRHKKVVIISIAVFAIIVAALVIQAFSSYSQRKQTVQTLNNFRQLQIARQTLELDSSASGRSANLDSIAELSQGNYLTKADLDRLTEGYKVKFFPTNNDENARDTPAIIGIGADQKVIVTQGGIVRFEKL